jgi:cation transport ATPase
MVEEAQSEKAETQRFLDRAEQFSFDKTGTLTEGKPRVTDIISGLDVIHLADNVRPEALDLL